MFYSYRENIKDVEKIKWIYFLFKEDIVIFFGSISENELSAKILNFVV